MYEVLNYAPDEILLAYIIIIASCILTYPIVRLIIGAVGKGLSKWR